MEGGERRASLLTTIYCRYRYGMVWYPYCTGADEPSEPDTGTIASTDYAVKSLYGGCMIALFPRYFPGRQAPGVKLSPLLGPGPDGADL